MEAQQDSSEHCPSTRNELASPFATDVDPFAISPSKGNDDSAVYVSNRQTLFTRPMPEEAQAYSCGTDFELSIVADDTQPTGTVRDSMHIAEEYPEVFLPQMIYDDEEEDELILGNSADYNRTEAHEWMY